MKEAGSVYSFKVLRKSDIGYVLADNDNTEYFLHAKEVKGEIKENDMILAFLYYDSKKRLAATMEIPEITVLKPGFASVKGVNKDLGVFMDIHIQKDILISKDLLPYNFDLWPVVGDTLYIQLKAKSNQLVAKIVGKSLIESPKDTLLEGDTVTAFVMKIMPEGVSCYTTNLEVIFIHKTQMRFIPRLGSSISVKIIRCNLDNDYNGSLIERKENQMDSDAELLLNYLKENDYHMKYGNDSSPEEIMKTFQMSKKAFKRALGHLYKERLIDFKDNETKYIGEEKNE